MNDTDINVVIKIAPLVSAAEGFHKKILYKVTPTSQGFFSDGRIVGINNQIDNLRS